MFMVGTDHTKISEKNILHETIINWTLTALVLVHKTESSRTRQLSKIRLICIR